MLYFFLSLNNNLYTKVYYILIFYIQISEFNSAIDEVTKVMNSTFLILTVFGIVLGVSLLILAILGSAISINRLIRPIIQLTTYAKAVNQTAHSSTDYKKMKKKVSIDIDQIKVYLIVSS